MVVHAVAAQALYHTDIIQVYALGASQPHHHNTPLEDAAAAAEAVPLVASLQVHLVRETTSIMNLTTNKDSQVVHAKASGVHFVN